MENRCRLRPIFNKKVDNFTMTTSHRRMERSNAFVIFDANIGSNGDEKLNDFEGASLNRIMKWSRTIVVFGIDFGPFGNEKLDDIDFIIKRRPVEWIHTLFMDGIDVDDLLKVAFHFAINVNFSSVDREGKQKRKENGKENGLLHCTLHGLVDDGQVDGKA